MKKMILKIYLEGYEEPILLEEETEKELKEYTKDVNEIFSSCEILNLFIDKKAIIAKPSQIKLILIEETLLKNINIILPKKDKDVLEEDFLVEG